LAVSSQTSIVTNWSASGPANPYAIVGISLICVVLLSLYSLSSPLLQQALIDTLGMQPQAIAELIHSEDRNWWNYPAVTVLTAIVLHANWLHLAGNLAYLWVFGLALENRLGSIPMLLIFVAGGALANISVALSLDNLETPIIGASGAVSAVVGCYLGLLPSRQIGLYLPLGLYLQFAQVPSLLVIGSWFTLQLLYTVFGPIDAAVAWWNHLAGFALGLSLMLLYRALKQFRA
jgi:membrane associated rhomboid family serine protease